MRIWRRDSDATYEVTSLILQRVNTPLAEYKVTVYTR